MRELNHAAVLELPTHAEEAGVCAAFGRSLWTRRGLDTIAILLVVVVL